MWFVQYRLRQWNRGCEQDRNLYQKYQGSGNLPDAEWQALIDRILRSPWEFFTERLATETTSLTPSQIFVKLNDAYQKSAIHRYEIEFVFAVREE